MSAGTWIAVGLVGGAGAVGRFVVDAAVSARWGRGFPLGTLVVNLTGAFALGLLTGLAPSTDVARISGTGLLGAYTTFSTWMLESERAAEEGSGRIAAANVVGSLVLGLAGAAAGRVLGRAL